MEILFSGRCNSQLGTPLDLLGATEQAMDSGFFSFRNVEGQSLLHLGQVQVKLFSFCFVLRAVSQSATGSAQLC